MDDITAVVIILLEGNPKDKSWGAACKVNPFYAQLEKHSCLISTAMQNISHVCPNAVINTCIIALVCSNVHLVTLLLESA